MTRVDREERQIGRLLVRTCRFAKRSGSPARRTAAERFERWIERKLTPRKNVTRRKAVQS